MSTNPQTKACEALDRIDALLTWANILGGVLALYVTLRVHTATKSIWKSFATFAIISLIIGSITIGFAVNAVKNNPCIEETMKMIEQQGDHLKL